MACSACGLQETRDHALQIGESTGDTEHTLVCACGYSRTETHTFELVIEDSAYKYKCACGEVQSTTESAWLQLQQQIDAAESDATITLSQDVTATELDGPLEISGKNITLDLAGHTLNRGLTEAAENGNVITNNGGLTIQGTGTITGGNTTGHGGGVYVGTDSWLNVEDEPIVHDNTDAAGKKSNVYLSSSDALIHVDKLTADDSYPVSIGVAVNRKNISGDIPTGLSGNGTADMFFSDLDGYAVRENEATHEAELFAVRTLTDVPYIDMSKAVRDMVAPVAYSVASLNENKLSGGSFYVVDENCTFNKPLEVRGDVSLILMDGCKLTAAKGIIVTLGNSLTIYPQSGGTGAINATGKESAGIGGSISPRAENMCGTVIIHGGSITARGDYGSAGIGGGCRGAGRLGYETHDAHGGDVTVYGGTVKAYGSMRHIEEFRKYQIGAGIGGGSRGNGFVYSVKTYAQKMSQNGSTEQMRGLAKALDDYGTAAQIYFTYGDYSGLAVDSAVTAVTLDDLAPYALTTSGTKPAGVTGASISVEFESDNTLRITFKTDGSKPLSDYTFLLDGAAATPAKSGKNARLQVVNIAAPNLDTTHTFTVSDGTDTYTVTASALSYAYTSVKNGTPERQNLGKALYLYNQAANIQFDN